MKVKVDSYLQPLMPKFLTYLAKETGVLRDAIEKSDFETLKAKGHSLKGTCGGYGFDELSALALQLEKFALAHDINGATQIYQSVATAVQSLEIEYIDEAV